MQQQSANIGSIVGARYELVAILGSGGMGTVFKARHVTLPKFFAIKILNRQFSNDINFRARFDQEAKTASLLNHPNLVSIHDYGTTEQDEAYSVMEFIDGRSLADVLTTLKRLDSRQAIKLFVQICEGLTHAHDLGVIHRDLKPGNIMLVTNKETNDFVKVVDFGIAKMVGIDGSVTHGRQSLTKTGEFFGSPLYMSPEQASGARVDHRTDIYSMGILMYECLTSAPPFRGENFFVTTTMHNEARPKPFNQALAIPEKLESIILKALEKDPDNRYQSMEALRLALLSVSDKDSTYLQRGKISTHHKNSQSKSVLLVFCALTLVAGGAALAYWYLPQTKSQRPKTMEAPVQAPEASKPAPVLSAAVELPPIADSIQLPDLAKSLSPGQLVNKGLEIEKKYPSQKNEDKNNLLAARYYMAAIQADPTMAYAYECLTDFYWRQHECLGEKESKRALAKCAVVDSEEIRHLPTRFESYLHRAIVNTQLDRWQGALDDADRGIKLRPDYIDIHFTRAYALHGLHRNAESIAEYEKYMRPQDRDCVYVLGVCYEELQRHKEAIAVMTKWLKKLGPMEGALLVRADAEQHLHMYKEAIADYQLLGKKWPHIDRAAVIEECKSNMADQGQN